MATDLWQVKTVAQGNPWISPSIGAPIRRIMANDLPDSSGLSFREREILRLMAKGKGNREIGNELHLATQTIKNKVKIIYSKLAVDSRVLAVLRAISFGIISLEEIIEEVF